MAVQELGHDLKQSRGFSSLEPPVSTTQATMQSEVSGEFMQVLAVARLRAEGLVSSAEQPIDVAGVGLSQPSEADFNLQELVAWADAELCFEAHGPPGSADVDNKVPHVVCASGSTEQWSGIDATMTAIS